MVIVVNTQVFAAKSSMEMREEYKKDKSIINKLSDEELKEWQKELKALQKIMMDPINQGYTQEDRDLVSEMLVKITDRQRGENTDSGKENGTGQSNEELKKYNVNEITEWLTKHSPSSLSKEVKDKWKKTIEESEESEEYKKQAMNLLEGKSLEETNKETQADSKGQALYKKPNITTEHTTGGSLDDVFKDGEALDGDPDSKIDSKELQEFSGSLYNIFLQVGIVMSVIIGGVLGIKFMLASAEEKAELKKMLMVYLVGCIVVFGSFAIWKIVVTILQDM